MAATLAPRPTFVPHVPGDDDPIGVTVPVAGRGDRLDLVRLGFWLAYIVAVTAALSYGASVLGAWLLDAPWIGLVPAGATGLVLLAALVGRPRPALS